MTHHRSLVKDCKVSDLAQFYVDALNWLKQHSLAALTGLCEQPEHRSRREDAAVALAAGESIPASRTLMETLAWVGAIHDLLSDPDLPGTPNLQLEEYGDRLLHTGNLLEGPIGSVGALVVSRQVPARPSTVPETADELFPQLRLVSVSSAERTARRRLPARFDVLPGLGDDLVVAALPWLADKDDVLLRRESGTPARYSGGPDNGRLAKHVAAALKELDDSGAHIGALPELSLDDELLKLWLAACRTGRPASSKLELILLGSGPSCAAIAGAKLAPGEGPNRAVLLTRNGQIVLAQDKQHGFTMTQGYRSKYTVFDGLGAGTLAEHVADPTGFNVLDIRAGSIGVLICEDLGRLTVSGGDMVELGVNLVLAPIFAPPIEAPALKKWYATAADALRSDGVAVVVCNGHAVARPDKRKHQLSAFAFFSDPGMSPAVFRGKEDTGVLKLLRAAKRRDALTARIMTL